MCGIFGVTGTKKDAPQQVLNHLKELEYRGYDSWGVGAKRGNAFELDKHVGKIGSATTILSDASIALGHTRWATHGGVTEANAHPHTDCTKRIVLVHNGIIENYQELSASFAKKHTIVSQTDTEIFAHLVEELLDEGKSFVDAVRLGFCRLKGLSAFVVADAQSDMLIAIKNGSPLILGLGKGANYVASDANCLLADTKRVIYLEDGQMAVLTKDTVNVMDAKTGEKVTPVITTIDWETSPATKEEYPHFMIKEIAEQPKILQQLCLNFDDRIRALAKAVSDHKKIYLVGCGSAYYAALTSMYLFSTIAHKETIAVSGSEFVYKEPFVDKESVVVFFSQSGETIDVIEPLKRIKQKGIQTVALVNVFGSSLYRLADEKIWLETGPEICVVTTKAFTAMVGMCMLAAYHIAENLDEGKRLIQQSIHAIENVLDETYQHTSIDPIVHQLSTHEHAYCLGKGAYFPLALESALKVKEVSYVHMEGFASGELKHGVIALIEQGTPCVVLAPQDESYSTVLSGAMEIKSRGGYVIGITPKENAVFNIVAPVLDCGIASLFAQVVVAQLIGYRLALKRNLDPDKPRNLAKSVTVV